MAKGIPLMGRDPDGEAKIINVDENGNLKVSLSGNIMAQDNEGNPVPLTVEKDDEGKAVLRIIDSAPFGYDPVTDATRTMVVGDRKILKTTIKPDNVLANKDDASYPDYNNREVIEIKPPQGKNWELLFLTCSVPKPKDTLGNSPTLGTHQLIVRYGENAGRGTLLQAEGTHLGSIKIEGGIITNAGESQKPSDPALQKQMLSNVFASYECPIYLVYQNKTDVEQAETRDYYYVVAERNELP